jgi:ABC-2 type transport system ATP-binding protein
LFEIRNGSDSGFMPAVARPELIASGICKAYHRVQVLNQVNLSAHAGEIVALTGENGAGKSTMMRICAGMVTADAGGVQIADRIGYCPQDASLFELLTADEHLVMFGRGVGLSRGDALNRGHLLLQEFDFPVGRRVVTADLSGGTRQKLNLAIALLGDPGLLLLDEPYQGFDRGTYVNFWDHCQTWRAQGKAIVIVTHMLAELNRVDRVVELRAHHQAPGLRG